MTKSVAGAVADIQSKALAITGIKAAPNTPPEAMSQLPFSVCYPRSGHLNLATAGFGTHFHTLVCELHFSRALLPTAVAQATPYIESVVNAIGLDPLLSSTVDEVNDVRYTFGKLEWGDEEHIGIQFEIDIKINQTFS